MKNPIFDCRGKHVYFAELLVEVYDMAPYGLIIIAANSINLKALNLVFVSSLLESVVEEFCISISQLKPLYPSFLSEQALFGGQGFKRLLSSMFSALLQLTVAWISVQQALHLDGIMLSHSCIIRNISYFIPVPIL